MMKSLLLGFLMLAAGSQSPQDYKIVGKCLDRHASGRVALITYNENNQADTIGKCSIANGKFMMTGRVPSSTVGYLLINDRLKDPVPVILDKASYRVVLDGNVVLSLTGTPEQDVLNKYLETRIEANRLLEEFRLRPLEERRNDSIRRYYQERDKEMAPHIRQAQQKLLEQYPDRHATAVFFTLGLKEKGLQELTAIYEKLSGDGRNNPSAEKILQRINRLRALETGVMAPNFSMKTPTGETLVLHDIPAKVKIVDFWASWCYPCRKENPLLVRLYEKYHDKGLEIIGISLDDNLKKWTDAIKKDQLPYLHVSELKKWKCSAVTLYDVKTVPHTVVIDANNRIIARNVRGEKLEQLIMQLFEE